MPENKTTPRNDEDVLGTEPISRQEQFEQILADALSDQNLLEALHAFQMGEQEYVRAMAGSTVIKFYSGNTSNPQDSSDAHLDSD